MSYYALHDVGDGGLPALRPGQCTDALLHISASGAGLR